MFGYKSAVAVLAVASLVGSSAFAADASLAPGKPAGVSKAQLQIGTGTLIVGLGAAAIITAVAIVVSDQSGNNSALNTSPGTGDFAAVTSGTTS
jgi:hypothetical protein